ncbi:hypothetical protein ONZ45_g14157 [Pleurotus djamor]|nr:hypothetical protein ONZ45_g14157 [Pleurotus djamor]
MIEEIFDDPPIPATPSNPEPLDSSPEPLSEFLPNGVPRVSQAKATSCTAFNPDLAKVPEEYHEFADVFSKGRAETLAEHRPYDLKIDLEEGAKPPVGGIIPLSQAEQLTVKKFIDEHLGMGFIRSTNSPHGETMKFFAAILASAFVAAVMAQDEPALGYGGQCGTIVGTAPCQDGMKCCYVGPDNGKCVYKSQKGFQGERCLFE